MIAAVCTTYVLGDGEEMAWRPVKNRELCSLSCKKFFNECISNVRGCDSREEGLDVKLDECFRQRNECMRCCKDRFPLDSEKVNTVLGYFKKIFPWV